MTWPLSQKDADFRQRAFLLGPPAKVIAIGLGNCTTTDVENLIRSRFADIQEFLVDPEATILVLP
jgi:predicted nuclease of predicted toxin-antitoxin system